eukprot:3538561-Prymnesium_polylepis.1
MSHRETQMTPPICAACRARHTCQATSQTGSVCLPVLTVDWYIGVMLSSRTSYTATVPSYRPTARTDECCKQRGLRGGCKRGPRTRVARGREREGTGSLGVARARTSGCQSMHMTPDGVVT